MHVYVRVCVGVLARACDCGWGIEVACSEGGALKPVGEPVCGWVLDWVGVGLIFARGRKNQVSPGHKKINGGNELHYAKKAQLGEGMTAPYASTFGTYWHSTSPVSPSRVGAETL